MRRRGSRSLWGKNGRRTPKHGQDDLRRTYVALPTQLLGPLGVRRAQARRKLVSLSTLQAWRRMVARCGSWWLKTTPTWPNC